MQLTHFLITTFAASALAVKFLNVVDTACQRYDGTYVPVTAAQFKDIILQEYPVATLIPEMSRSLHQSPEDRKSCPSNSDDTYKWIPVPQWHVGSPWSVDNSAGALAIVYYKETDTYNVCRYLAAAQSSHGYAGFCK
ncbi:hypothetical protein GQ44DRAFT_628960 [Phaeosphaeriaceae sp. PMI808]|nr:hypothetical protein GQ44DRAFT_628960 [Phaeosphaeriaceae sp. PMI808]